MVVLNNESNVLARTLRWWVCHLELQNQYVTYPQAALGTLTHMLGRNKALCYLTVVVNKAVLDRFKDELMRFNLQKLEGVGELPVACKLAFLSVFHADVLQSPMKKQAKDEPDRVRLQAPMFT